MFLAGANMAAGSAGSRTCQVAKPVAWVLAGFVFVTACGDDDASSNSDATSGDGATPTSDAGGNDAGTGCLPSLDPSWLLAWGQEHVAKLSGEEALSDGSTLSTRATANTRSKTAAYLQGVLQDLGLQVWRQEYGTGSNVYAAQVGPDDLSEGEVLLLGAHYDTVPGSPGANDNATGVATVLAGARWLAESDCKSSVALVFFDQEEIGLVGSEASAEYLAENRWTIDSVHTVDQLGWDKDDDLAIELELPPAFLAERYKAAAKLVGNPPLRMTSVNSTDHQSFRALGYSAVGLTEEYVNGDTTPYYHSAGDSYETVDWTYWRSSTRLVLAMLYNYAANSN